MTGLSETEILARDGVTVARVRGEIDLSNVNSLLRTLGEAAIERQRGIVVDLSGVEYLDSAGVRLLFRLARAVGSNGRDVRVVVPAGVPIRRVLDLVGAAEAVPILESEEEAIADLLGNREG